MDAEKAKRSKTPKIIKSVSINSRSKIGKNALKRNKKLPSSQWQKVNVIKNKNAVKSDFSFKKWGKIDQTPKSAGKGKLFKPSDFPGVVKKAADVFSVEESEQTDFGRFSAKEYKQILSYAKFFGFNFYAASSKASKEFGKKISVEDVKDLCCKVFPMFKQKSKFDLDYEKKRKSELEKLQHRSAETECKFVDINYELKLLENEIIARKQKAAKVPPKNTENTEKINVNLDHYLAKLPKEVTENTNLELPKENVYLASATIKTNVSAKNTELQQSVDEYLFSMLNYDKTEPIKLTSVCTVKLWNTLRMKVLVLQKLQRLCRKKKNDVSKMEAAILNQKHNNFSL